MSFEEEKEVVEENVEDNLDDQKNSNNSNMRKKLMKIMLLLVGVLVIILIVMLIVSLVSSKDLEYEDIEVKMKDAAVNYYEVQKGLLPQEEGEIVSVDVSTLSKNEYMKPLSELRKKESCTGKVEVTKISNKYIYTPYLNCGDNYNTKELYKVILEQGFVTSESGLYEINGEKVYRGENVNNYVKLDNNLFRIVKVTNDNKIMLILNDVDYNFSSVFDNRYNINKGYNSGFNDYPVSRLYSYLTDLYNNKGKEVFLTENDKKNLVPFNLCIGKSNVNVKDKNNSVECSNVLENQMIGLLTASDYVRASTDVNCSSLSSKSCQNYNYLKLSGDTWWLITALDSNTNEVFTVNSSGYIVTANAAGSKRARPVIMVSNRAMLKSGKGTFEKPYVLK